MRKAGEVGHVCAWIVSQLVQHMFLSSSLNHFHTCSLLVPQSSRSSYMCFSVTQACLIRVFNYFKGRAGILVT